MKFNILTVLWRTEYLEKQYESIPKKKDVNWILCKSNLWKNNIPDYIKNSEDVNVIICNVDIKKEKEHVSDFILKINEGIKIIENGFFYILDDDNKIHEKTYKTYEEYKNKNYKMIIGKQIRSNNTIRLQANYPSWAKIDMGNVICTTEILKKINFNCVDSKNKNYDWQFWLACFKEMEKENVLLLNQICFYYNGLR
jgi:hypothetical protein